VPRSAVPGRAVPVRARARAVPGGPFGHIYPGQCRAAKIHDLKHKEQEIYTSIQEHIYTSIEEEIKVNHLVLKLPTPKAMDS